MTETTSSLILRRILEDLYLLAELKPGKTLSIKTKTVVDHTTLTSWYRWWHDEDRFKSIDLVYSIVDQTKSYIKTSLDESNRKSIHLALVNCSVGVTSLRETYIDDYLARAKINAVLAVIQSLIQECQPVSTLPPSSITMYSLGLCSRRPSRDCLVEAETKSLPSMD